MHSRRAAVRRIFTRVSGKLFSVMNLTKQIGRQTLRLETPPSVSASAAVVGRKEGGGPIGHCFDYISPDAHFGEASWEKAESAMLKKCFELCCAKGNIAPSELDYIFSGDLLNQCVGSAFALRDSGVPYFGLYGACSTMGEAMTLAAVMLDGGFASKVCAITGSHFCSSERQFRFPLEYGGQRAPTAQWTVTGSGAVILQSGGSGPFITYLTPGKIVDAGINDANNMGSAMAPAAYETLKAHFEDTGREPDYYDMIITGDLGAIGHDTVEELFRRDGLGLGRFYTDCGVMIFDREKQDVHSGGSGCGCSAAVFASFVMQGFAQGKWERVLFAPTGALMSPTSTQQGQSIPGVCHALAVEKALPSRG